MTAGELKYEDLITIENLFQAWDEFKKEKRSKGDVQAFERCLEDNIFGLRSKLSSKKYQHGIYQEFYVNDPKRRHIHKAQVRDRVVHHLLYKYLYELFDKSFIYDSYSCRVDKGTHRGVLRLGKFARTISRNFAYPCWALKLDIKKFFANVDHQILLDLLKQRVKDPDILWLLLQIIDSFSSDSGEGKGIPLGNLTSQVFANIYMNELDQFVKHTLKLKYYLRYADDFVILSTNKKSLERLITPLESFLKLRLKLDLHPNKIIFRKLSWGIDMLGYNVLPHYILPRRKTVKRMFKKIAEKSGSESFNQTLASYLGYLSHANAYELSQKLKNQYCG